MTTADTHHNEYLAAIAGLPEQTITPRHYAVGDFVSGYTELVGVAPQAQEAWWTKAINP